VTLTYSHLFGVTADKLEKKVREFYDIVCRLEEEKYDWEFKLRKMDFEVWHAPQTVPDTLQFTL